MNSLIFLTIICSSFSMGYPAGAIIALLILAYLMYALIKPEKF